MIILIYFILYFKLINIYNYEEKIFQTTTYCRFYGSLF